ncbi:MAG: tetratricopeptide repeat protein [Planctomycetes bacterium]|nr:tetratricopeptide repeat protein [Planctomycetota bacterium]
MGYEDIIKRAEDALARENFDYAITLLLDIVLADPKQGRARSLLRQAEIRKFQQGGSSAAQKLSGFLKGITSRFGKKDATHSIAGIERALRDSPGNTSLMLDLAEKLKEAMLADQAIDTLEQARGLDNQNAEVLRRLVYYYEGMGQFGKAQTRAQEYVQLHPTDKEMTAKLKDVSAKRHIELSAVEKAKSFRDQIIDEEKAIDLEKGQRMVRSEEEMTQAVASAKAAVEKDPNDHISYVKLGDLYQQQGRFKEAMEYYKTAYKISPDYPTREKMGDLAIRSREEQVKAAQKAVEANPGDPEAAKRLAAAKKARIDYSIQEYQARVKQHPTDLSLRFRLARSLFENDQTDEAIQQFQQTVGDPKAKVDSQWYLGRCFMKKNLPDLAANQYKAALQAPGLSSQMKKEITYNLGEAYEAMGQIEEARKIYQQIFEVDITYKDVADKVSQLRSAE